MSLDHRLSAGDRDTIYRTQILPEFLPPENQAAARPVAIITGGQPGSGKSRLTSLADNSLADPSNQVFAVVIDADRLRLNHPAYEQLRQLDDKEAANQTHFDAGRWAQQLTTDAIAARQHLVIDQTSRDPDALLRLTDRLAKNGYSVELWAMAVPAEVSQMRIELRYATQKHHLGYGRYSTAANHVLAYDGLAAAVAAVERSDSLTALKLFDQDHRIVHERTASSPARTSAGVQLDEERRRPLNGIRLLQQLDGYATVLDIQRKQGMADADIGRTADRLIECRKALLTSTAVHAGQAGTAYSGPLIAGDAHQVIQRCGSEPVRHVRANLLAIGPRGLAVDADRALSISYSVDGTGVVRNLLQHQRRSR